MESGLVMTVVFRRGRHRGLVDAAGTAREEQQPRGYHEQDQQRAGLVGNKIDARANPGRNDTGCHEQPEILAPDLPGDGRPYGSALALRQAASFRVALGEDCAMVHR